MIAVDGKALRGSRITTCITLLAAMDYASTVLAQRQVADKSNETPAFAPLPDVINLAGTVITTDVLHIQHAYDSYLRKRGAGFVHLLSHASKRLRSVRRKAAGVW